MTSTTSLPSNIKALQTQPTEPQTVKVVSIPFSTDPQVSNLASDEVIVKERAVAINPTDWKHAAGMWGEPHRICGCDGSGDIVAVGSGVNDLSVGDRVAGFTYGTVTKNNGAFAEYTRYKAHAVFKLPDSMSYEEGASYPIPLFTAIQALSFRLNLSPSQDSGKTIFIYSGASAVGYQAIQLSKKYFGLKVITTASPHNHEALKQAGADVTIDYKVQDWIQKVASNGKIDYALDCISENGVTTKVIDTLVKSGTEGAKLITLLPVSEEDSKRSDKVEVEFTLAYCVLGGEVHFAKGAVNFDVKLYDVIQLHHWNRHILPELMGSKKLIGAKLKAMPGGLEGINDAFQYMKDGKVSNEKLVLTI